MSEFKDHFSSRADIYRRFRPNYPDALFAWLAELAGPGARAWDCATGNGQAALALAEHLDSVIATDASADQIDQAPDHPRVSFRVATAEHSGLEPGSIDLVTVAQALHWLDFDAFYAEVRRVAKPGAALVAWTYGFYRVDSALDAVTERYSHEILGPWWPYERVMVNNSYRDIPFPFDRLDTPAFAMTADWDLSQLIGYLGTWSARKLYMDARDDDPLDQVRPDLEAAWGEPARVRQIRWPLTVLAGRV